MCIRQTCAYVQNKLCVALEPKMSKTTKMTKNICTKKIGISYDHVF